MRVRIFASFAKIHPHEMPTLKHRARTSNMSDGTINVNTYWKYTRRFFTSPEHEHTAAKKNRYQCWWWMQWQYILKIITSAANAVCTIICHLNQCILLWTMRYIRAWNACDSLSLHVVVLFPISVMCNARIKFSMNWIHMNEISWLQRSIENWMDGWMHECYEIQCRFYCAYQTHYM